jgi:transcriptional regulator with XRE-family HTH domain
MWVYKLIKTILANVKTLYNMNLGDCIKKTREAKGLSQKEVALAAKIDSSNYSKIESGKTDPAFSSISKIAKALGVELTDLFKADTVLKDINSLDKSLMEKLALIEQLDKKEKSAFYSVLDAFIGKKKLKDALGSVLLSVE